MKTLFFIILCFGLIGCDSLFKDENLQIAKVPYTGNELRIDGYYYRQESDKTWIQFFYRDGVMLDFISSFSTTNLSIVDEGITDMYERLKNNKLVWQVFLIDNNTIQYSGWSTSVGGGRPSFRCVGTIENDTTFCVIKSVNSDGKEFEKNDIYHFRQFSPKPDSSVANKWIK